MRRRIAGELGVQLYDIYGLTEIYGPGIAISCDYEDGMHYWDDYVYCEVIDPKTGENVPDGTMGELVITTLRKQGAPLIRYRTHDLSGILTPAAAPIRASTRFWAARTTWSRSRASTSSPRRSRRCSARWRAPPASTR